jgi:hypothetical protein
MPEHGYSYFFGSPYVNKVAEFAKLRDTFAGNERVKDANTVYLPQPGGMNDANYAKYKARTLFYPVIERTVRGLLGIVFRVAPVFTLPGPLKAWQDSMTPEGDSIMEAFRVAIRENLHMGRCGILLDLPEDAPVNAMPFVSMYAAENITAWERRYIKGQRRLTRVMLREQTDTDGDDQGRFLELILDTSAATPVYRVKKWTVKFTPGKTRGRLEVAALSVADHTPVVNGKTLDYIPFYFIGPYDNKPDLCKSPLLDLADANLHHYQLQADYRQTLYMVAQPTPYMIGDIPDDKVPNKIGAGVFWTLPSEVTDIGMLEFSGAGIGALLDALTRCEEYMAALGAKLVHRQTQPETAEAVKTNSRDELSVIEAVVQSTRDAFKLAINDAAKWVGASAKGDVAVDTDFAEGRMDPAMLTALFQTMQAGGLSREVYHRNLQRGDIMPPNRTLAEETAAVEQEAAERQAKAQEAMAAQQDAMGTAGDLEDGDEDEQEGKPAAKPPGKGKPPKAPKGKKI